MLRRTTSTPRACECTCASANEDAAHSRTHARAHARTHALTQGMGWGLRTLEDVKAGTLIREYMGEVVNEDMMADRMQSHSKHR